MPKPQIVLVCADQHSLGFEQLQKQLGKVSADVFQGGVSFWKGKAPKNPEFCVTVMIKPGDLTLQQYVDVMVEPTDTPSKIFKTCLRILKLNLKILVNDVNATVENIERAY